MALLFTAYVEERNSGGVEGSKEEGRIKSKSGLSVGSFCGRSGLNLTPNFY